MKKMVGRWLLSVLLLTGPAWALQEDQIPQHVSVLPVFFVPRGQAGPTPKHIDMVMKHLEITQQCYKDMLKGRDTFTIAESGPQEVPDRLTLVSLKKLPGKERTKYLLRRLFKHFEINRFNCPYVFLVIIMCPNEAWPPAGGRPINGGFNGGGGIAVFSSNKFDAVAPLIQGSFQHELGHAFGLVHVDCYGYDQYANKSVMSYNKENVWSGYNHPRERGILIPEDIRALSMNKRVFPNLYSDPKQDVPKGYKIYGKLIRLSYDTHIPGQKPYNIEVTTSCGQENGTNANNIILSWIRPNRKPKKGIGLVEGAMWMSGKAKGDWADIELKFPISVHIRRIRVHSQCGGGLYPVKAIRVEADMQGFKEVGRVESVLKDEVDVAFREVKAKRWRLYFRPDESRQVVIRGLQFYSSHGEIFCPNYPTYLMNAKK
jgi:hypothetical protein